MINYMEWNRKVELKVMDEQAAEARVSLDHDFII